jgi:hypothetical protein
MWQKIIAALGIVVTLIAMAVGGAFGRIFGDAAFQFLSSDDAATTSSVPTDQMPSQRAGQLSLKYSFPFVLNEAESKSMMSGLPANVRSQVRSLSVYTSRPTCGLGEVRLLVGVYAPEVQVSIDGAAAGTTKQVSTLEGITNPEDSITPTTVSGHPARRVSYKANRWGGVLGGEFLVVADLQSNTFWQLQFIFAAKKTSDHTKLNNIRSCANEVLASASIEPAP